MTLVELAAAAAVGHIVLPTLRPMRDGDAFSCVCLRICLYLSFPRKPLGFKCMTNEFTCNVLKLLHNIQVKFEYQFIGSPFKVKVRSECYITESRLCRDSMNARGWKFKSEVKRLTSAEAEHNIRI